MTKDQDRDRTNASTEANTLEGPRGSWSDTISSVVIAYDSLDSEPSVSTFSRRAETFSDVEHLKLNCGVRTRYARDMFIQSCEATDPEDAEASFSAANGAVDELWDFAQLRGVAFQDLLGLIDAAIRRVDDISSFNPNQRDILRQAFADLPRPFIEEATVSNYRKRFAEANIDILGPLRVADGVQYKVTIEEIR